MKPKATAGVLQKFYPVGIRNAEVTLPLCFENPGELFDSNLTAIPGKTRFVNPDFFARLDEINETLPRRTKLCLSFTFSDRQGFSADRLREILEDNLQLRQLKISGQIFKISLISVVLTMLGLLFLLLSYFLSKHDVAQLWCDFINISGTFMVWDGVSRFVIDRFEKRKQHKQYEHVSVEVK